MKALIGDCSTAIFLTGDEMKEHCKIGEQAKTCIWLLFSGKGPECCYWNKPWALLDRWTKGLTVAKRDGCDKVRGFDRFGEGTEVEF